MEQRARVSGRLQKGIDLVLQLSNNLPGKAGFFMNK